MFIRACRNTYRAAGQDGAWAGGRDTFHFCWGAKARHMAAYHGSARIFGKQTRCWVRKIQEAALPGAEHDQLFETSLGAVRQQCLAEYKSVVLAAGDFSSADLQDARSSGSVKFNRNFSHVWRK